MNAQQGLAFLPGARIRLREGDRVRILPLDHPKPLQIRFEPVDFPESFEGFGLHDVRYELWMRIARNLPPSGETGYFNELFRLVEDVA